MKLSRHNFVDQGLWQRLRASVHWLTHRISTRPKIAIILGSGLGSFAEKLHQQTIILTSDIPHYPAPTVEGHRGRIVLGAMAGRSVIAFQGRVHLYETGELDSTLYPVYVAALLGIRTLLVTNAAGSVKHTLQPGHFMMIVDQINMTFENPLRCLTNAHRLRKRSLYDSKLQSIIEQVAYERGISLQRGTYCGLKGPSYETAAEIEMVRRLRADAVGMSTVHEVSLACALGMRVGGISCISNFATGIGTRPLSHNEVTEVGKKVRKHFERLLEGIIRRL